MSRHHFLVLFSAMGLALAATTAQAEEFSHCDANEQSCYCPSSLPAPYDTCSDMDLSNMVTPDDPVALRDAANIQTTYDDNTDTFTITADVRDLNAAGALPLNSNRGQWASKSQFRNYMTALLGLDDYPLDCFERMRFKQVGTVRRIDQAEGELAAKDNMHVVLAAISGPAGEMVIDADGDGSTQDENFVTLGGRVTNTASQCTPDDDGKLSARQCSSVTQTRYEAEWVGDLCDPSSGGTYSGLYEMAGGRLFDPRWEGEETQTRCIFWGPAGNCQAFFSMEVLFDSAQITNVPYFNGSPANSSIAQSNNTAEVSTHHPGADGICSDGQGERGAGYVVTPDTKVNAPQDCHGSP